MKLKLINNGFITICHDTIRFYNKSDATYNTLNDKILVLISNLSASIL